MKMSTKKIRPCSITLIIVLCLIIPLLGAATTETKTGTVTAVISGDGGKDTVITISLGSNDGLNKEDKGWVTKDNEAIAYIKIFAIEPDSASAIVTQNPTTKKVSSGLPVYLKVEQPSEPKDTVKPIKKPDSSCGKTIPFGAKNNTTYTVKVFFKFKDKCGVWGGVNGPIIIQPGEKRIFKVEGLDLDWASEAIYWAEIQGGITGPTHSENIQKDAEEGYGSFYISLDY
jgi:hypothetical protein